MTQGAMVRTLLLILLLAMLIMAVDRFAPDGTQERLARKRMDSTSTVQGAKDGSHR
jgi:hypothetical protein